MGLPCAHAQSQKFTMESFPTPESVPDHFNNIGEADTWLQQHEKDDSLIQNQIELKYKNLTQSNFIYSFITPNDRENATQEIIQLTQNLPTQKFENLRDCINQHPLALTACKDEASKVFQEPEITHNERLTFLAEGMIFRDLNDLIQLQSYTTSLRLLLNQYLFEKHNRPSKIESIKKLINDHDPLYDCTSDIGTLRLDQESVFHQTKLPTPLKNTLIQEQGFLGTCYANAASTAIEALTGKAVSSLELAVDFLYHDQNKKLVELDNFGGQFCETLEIAKTKGACERKFAWVENGIQKLKGGQDGYTYFSDPDNKKAKSMQLFINFFKLRNQLSLESMAILPKIAFPLTIGLRTVIGSKAPERIESAFTTYVKFGIDFLKDSNLKYKILEDFYHYDLTHAQDLAKPLIHLNTKNDKDTSRASDLLLSENKSAYETILEKHLKTWDKITIHQYFDSYLVQGAMMMTQEKFKNHFLETIKTRSKISQWLKPFLNSSQESSPLEDLLILTYQIIDPLTFNQNQNQFDTETLIHLMYEGSAKAALKYFIAPECSDDSKRVSLQNLSCQSNSIKYSGKPIDETAHQMRIKLIQSLQKGIPLEISYCTEVFGNEFGSKNNPTQCSPHSSLITGIRFNANKNKCELMLWNSWGARLGKTWIEESSLLQKSESFSVINQP